MSLPLALIMALVLVTLVGVLMYRDSKRGRQLTNRHRNEGRLR